MTTVQRTTERPRRALAAVIAAVLLAPAAASAQPTPGRPGMGPTRPPLKALDVTRRPQPLAPRPGEFRGPQKGPSATPPPPPGPGRPGAPAPAGGPGGPARELPGEHEFNECRKVPAGRKIKLTLKPESELQDLVGWISGMTCRKFILPSTVRSQKVTIIAPEPVSAAEAYRLFLSALATMGLTVEATGGFLRIIESNRGKESNVTMCAPDEDCPQDDRFVTRMIKLKYVSADEMMAVLNRLKSKDADIIAYQPSNTLIVSEWGSNLKRLVEIVDALDIGTAVEKIFFIKLKYAYAAEVAGKLQEIFGITVTGTGGTGGRPTHTPTPPRSGPGGRPYYGAPAGLGGESVGEAASELNITRIVADDRTHSLILVCTELAFNRIRQLVHKIDVPPALGRQRIHVYYLANANADEMAGVLQGLVSGSGRAGSMAGRPGTTTGTTGRPGTTTPYSSSTYGSTGYGAGGYGMGMQGQFQLFESPISISSDKGTNALVIIATMEDFLQLREVINKLDRPRRQVFVEAVILEVSLDRALNLGTSFHAGNTYDVSMGKQSGTGILFGGSITDQTANSILLSPSALSGLAVGFRGPEIPNAENLLGIPGLSLPAFGVFFQALQTNNDVNVLSAPHILTTDNEKAEITVGQNLPFQGALMGGFSGFGGSTTGTTGTSGSSAAGFFPSVSVQRQDVALKLSLTPHVNEGDFVRIELDQEVSDIASQNFNGLGPSTSKRTAKTVVVCKDTQTVVIGGLMSERTIMAETKVPLLGDLPILGYLFKSTKKTTQKTNLLIFLTPYIIKDQNDLRNIFERKLRERREFLERYTSFRDRDFASAAVYRTRRGMLAELERTARQAEEEAKLLDQAEKQLERTPDDEGPIMDAPPSATRKGARGATPTGPGTAGPRPMPSKRITAPLRAVPGARPPIR